MADDSVQLNFERDVLFSELQKMLDFAKTDIKQFKCRISDVAALKKDFTRVQNKIEKFQIKKGSFDAEKEKQSRERFNLLFYDIKVIVDDLKQKENVAKLSKNSTFNQSFEPHPKIKLPALALPDFHGDPVTWNSFHDIFTSIVHSNAMLTDIEKFRYLLVSVHGEPLNLIRSIPLTADNYLTAYESLQHRYSNKRIIATKHLDKILDMENMSDRPFLCERGIRNIVNTVQENLSALRVMKFPIEEWSFILLNVLLRKLSSYVRKRFEQSLEMASDIPKLSDLLDFLEKELATNEIMSSSAGLTTERHQSQNSWRGNPRPHTSMQMGQPKQYAGTARTQAAVASNTPRSLHTFCTSNSKEESKRVMKCFYCKSAVHLLSGCEDFIKLNELDRSNFIHINKICKNCLISGHTVATCRSRFNCKHCAERHHSILHNDKVQSKISEKIIQSDAPAFAPTTAALSCAAASSAPLQAGNCSEPYCVLLATALVDVRQIGSTCVQASTIRALIDPGSQTSLMTEACVQRLGLTRHHSGASISISGVGNGEPLRTRGTVYCDVFPRNKLQPKLNIKCYVIPNITNYEPNFSSLDYSILPHIHNLSLADHEYYKSTRSVELLLGADYSDGILLQDNIVGPRGTPVAINSIFGYLLSGRVSSKISPQSPNVCLTSFHSETDLQKFWELESVPETKLLSPDELLCESIFVETHTRDPSGRYTVALPFKPDAERLGDSREIALSRFHKLEGRLMRNPSLRLDYQKCLQEYLDLGHMELVPSEEVLPTSALPHLPQPYGMQHDTTSIPRPSDEIVQTSEVPHSPQHYVERSVTSTSSDEVLQTSENYYLPHHCVVRRDATTTKTRVVFDASCKTTNGRSLNDNLLTGQKLQQDIVLVLLKFRIHEVVFTADIKMMYRFISVRECDRDYQLILWRPSQDQPISTYRLTTVTFGVSAAPYLALRTLRQLAYDEGEKYPLARRAILSDVFVDDAVTGANSVHDALALQRELIQLCQAGGFQLRKWSSNHPALLSSVIAEEGTSQQEALVLSSLEDDTTVKVLGLKWTPKSDNFTYDIHVGDRKECTKRFILSEISKIFDPLGFLSPITIFAKIMIQSLWLAHTGWDERPPQLIIDTWERFVSELPGLSSISLPRHILQKNKSVQIHGFSDASEKAYSACVYIRLITNDGQVQTHLVIAKTKVAPVKRLSVPRLELLGAHILSKLIQLVFDTYKEYVKFEEVYAWCDSSIVIAWLRSSSHEWRTFVSNRITLILSHVPASRWRHVRSADNPADAASRGVLPSELNAALWFDGPPWLKLPETEWPQLLPDYSTKEERRSNTQVLIASEKENVSIQFLCKFSQLGKLLRVVSYMFRFFNKCKKIKKNSYNTNFISCEESNFALERLILLTQQEVFQKDIKQLNSNMPCSTNIQKLKPFLDPVGLLRVGGRIERANLDFNAKHQIILPKDNFLTDLVIDHYHVINLHVGPQTLQYALSQRYWILSARNAVRKRTRRCVRCFRARPTNTTPPMAALPKVRVRPARPFLQVGVDYAGYFQTRTNRLRNSKIYKTYVCVFVCLSSKAIHLELVPDLTTQAFLAALRRMVARRGICSDIYSDCGRNFVGCNKYLKELISFLNDHKTEIQASSAAANIRWHFLPPYSPHMGGIWETNVKSFKQHLHRVVGSQILTYDEFNTLLCQIEAVLNSRPLSTISNDSSDPLPITPAHFLIGEPLTSLPEYDFAEENPNRLQRWQLLQQMVQHYWKRWSREYLHQLQQRGKWFHNTTTPLAEGSMVLIHSDSLPPTQWQYGRVLRLHKGIDNEIRVVTLRVGNSTTQRAVAKVYPLPIEQ